MNKSAVYLIIASILLVTQFAGLTSAADITIDAAASAKPVRMHNFYGGYHHNRFYFERSTAFKRAHDIFKECAHRRPTIKYWRCQNIFTYRHNPPGSNILKKYTEDRSGHCYDTERYASTGGYNWAKVNEVFDEIVTRSGLLPIVEFNYMPECMALDINDIGSYGIAIISPPGDHNEWSDLIRNTVVYLQNRYGEQETRNWYWGVWNEPNSKLFWNSAQYGYGGFFKLYDYSSVPLKDVDGELRIGGPDNTAVKEYSKRFVTHSHSGINCCNGQTGSACDYYSIHAYSHAPRFVCKEVWQMAADVLEIYGSTEGKKKKLLITETAPTWQLIKMPFVHTRYTAAWLLALVDSFLEAADIHGEFYLPKQIHYCGILRNFGKRSLMVYIGENNNSNQVLKTAPFNVYEVLSFLSEERIPVQGCDFPAGYTDVNDRTSIGVQQVRCMATRTPGRSIEILVYHFNQDDRLVYNLKDDGKDPAKPYGTYKRITPLTKSVSLAINNIPFTNARYTKYIIDKDHSNSFAYRQMNGGTNDYSKINAHDDLERTENKIVTISNGKYTEDLQIQQNSVALITLENENVEPGPHLGMYPDSIDFAYKLTSERFTLYNYGDQSLTWTIVQGSEQNWISVEPVSGSLAPNSNETVTVMVDRSGLEDGDYSSTISITSNGGNKVLNISMNVGIPPLPEFYLINAGGGYYTDTQGREWSSDREYTPGGFGYEGGIMSSTDDLISRTDDDAIYQTERYKLTAYRFDVPDGNYKITLHFAEIYFKTANERLMSVAIEGETKISDLDIFNTVGHDAALVCYFSNIPVTDGRMDITFSASSRVPKISGIEVVNMNLVEPEDFEPPYPPQNVRVTGLFNP